MKMKNHLLFLVTFCSLVVICMSQSCTWTDPKTLKKYDLSPLKSATDYHLSKIDTGKSWEIWMNACEPVFSTICGAGVAACQQWDANNPNGKASLGQYSTGAFQEGVANKGGYGLTEQFTNGFEGRKMEIDWICDTTIDIGKPMFTNESPSKHYNFQWKTKYACPIGYHPSHPSGKISGGSIILILLFVIVVIYVVAGAIINKFVRNKDGIHIFPNVDFWITVPYLVKDGAMFIVNKTCRRGSEYGAIAVG